MTDQAGETANPSRLERGDGVSIAYHRQAGKRDLGEAQRSAPAVAVMSSSDGDLRPGVMFLGGFKSDMTGTKAVALAEYCRRIGQDFVRFDYQGHGVSSGIFEQGTIGTWLGDTLAVLDEVAQGPQVLVGSSMGGWLMLLAALARPHRVVGLVGIAPAPDFTENLMWARLPEPAKAELAATGRLVLPSAYEAGGYVISRDLIEEGRRHLLLDAPIPLNCPVRLLHGTADADVPWQLSIQLAEALVSADVVVSLVKGGDHRLSRPDDLARLTAAVAELSGNTDRLEC